METLDPGQLTDIVRRATGRPDLVVGSWEVAPVIEPQNMTTAALDRVSGRATDGTSWSVVAKTLRVASESPLFAFVPEQFHAEVLRDLDWRDEPRVYRSGLAGRLPAPLRFPALWHVDEGPHRIVLWLEDVADEGGWDLDRYHRSARALGRVAARWPEDRVLGELGLRRRPMADLFAGKVVHADLPALDDDGLWADPGVAAAGGEALRADLRRIAGVVPALLERLEGRPHGLAHGDASPANLLEPGDGSVVAVDWSYGSSAALGSDLSQLFAGRFESGEAAPDEVDGIVGAIVDGYLEGLADEGVAPDRTAVVEAFAANLVVRSAFCAIPLPPGPPTSPERRADLLVRRGAMAREAVTLVEGVLTA